MTSTETSRYLDAFGVPDFLHYAPLNLANTALKINTKCLIIEAKNPHSFCKQGETQDFLFKMLNAINLSKSDIECISTSDLHSSLKKYNAKTVLLMGKGLTHTGVNTHFYTHHPSEILNNTTFKRESWELLKQLQQCL